MVRALLLEGSGYGSARTVDVFWADGEERLVGRVKKRGHGWVALAPDGVEVLFRASRQRDVVNWIGDHPYADDGDCASG